MGPYEIVLVRQAARDLADLPRNVRRRLERALEGLSENPFRSRPGCDIRWLHGAPGRRSLRVGHYRAIFEVHGKTVRVLACAHRSVVYR